MKTAVDKQGCLHAGSHRQLASIDIVYYGMVAEKLGKPFDCFVDHQTIRIPGTHFCSSFLTYDQIIDLPWKPSQWMKHSESVSEYLAQVERGCDAR